MLVQQKLFHSSCAVIHRLAYLPGLVLGAAAAVILGQLLESFLLGVSPLDPTAFATVGCALLVVVLVASFVPARSAARVDPNEALRY